MPIRESNTSPRRIEAVEKQRQALGMRMGGATLAQIALSLQYKSPQAVAYALDSALRRTVSKPAENVRQLELARLDSLLLSLWQRATGSKGALGDLAALDRVLTILAHRWRLLGLVAERPIAVNVANSQTVQATQIVLSPEHVRATLAALVEAGILPRMEGDEKAVLAQIATREE